MDAGRYWEEQAPRMQVTNSVSGLSASKWEVSAIRKSLPDDDPLLTPTGTINTAERDLLRRRLIEEAIEDVSPIEGGHRPILYLMGGGSASGKGHVLESLRERGVIPNANVVHLDPDELKTKIPEYSRILQAGDSRAAAVVHEESSILGKRILDESLERRLTLIWDVTLGNPRKALDSLRKAAESGYEIILFGVTTDPDTAVGRCMERGSSSGRYVHSEALLKTHRGFSQGFRAYSEMVDKVILYDTNGKHPTPIAMKLPGQELRILNTERFREFERKAGLNVTALGPGELYPPVVRVEPPTVQYSREDYIERSISNLIVTSRTANGIVDTTASADKVGKLADNLSGSLAATLAQDNYRRVIGVLYMQRMNRFDSPRELRQFVEGVVRQVNAGITRDGVLYREHSSSKYPSYTAVADLQSAADEFYSELHSRLSGPLADPVETAAWVEYRMDLTDHLWADGCGKSAKAIAAWVLMRSDCDLPTYPADRAMQFAYAPKLPRSTGESVDAIQYISWLEYYRGLFAEGNRMLAAGDLSADRTMTVTTKQEELIQKISKVPPMMLSEVSGAALAVEAMGPAKPEAVHGQGRPGDAGQEQASQSERESPQGPSQRRGASKSAWRGRQSWSGGKASGALPDSARTSASKTMIPPSHQNGPSPSR